MLETVNIDMNLRALNGAMAYAPVVDGVFIKQSPTVALNQSLVNGVSIRHQPQHSRLKTDCAVGT